MFAAVHEFGNGTKLTFVHVGHAPRGLTETGSWLRRDTGVSLPQNCFGTHDPHEIRNSAHAHGARARGVIAAIGKDVQDFEVGDEVYG